MLRLALGLALWLSCGGFAPAQGGQADPDPLEPGRLEQARDRWESMTPEQRAELKRRFEELRTLDADGRRELERRHRELREREQAELEGLPQPERERLEALSPDQRRSAVRELAREALERRGRSIRERLPEGLRERLEGADGRERRALLEELKRARQGERMEHALGKLERELELPDGERRGPGELRPEEREARLFELHRRRVERRVEGEGLPEWIAPEEWRRWGELPPREFHERLDRSRRERGAGGFREAFGPRRGLRPRREHTEPSQFPERADPGAPDPDSAGADRRSKPPAKPPRRDR